MALQELNTTTPIVSLEARSEATLKQIGKVANPDWVVQNPVTPATVQPAHVLNYAYPVAQAGTIWGLAVVIGDWIVDDGAAFSVKKSNDKMAQIEGEMKYTVSINRDLDTDSNFNIVRDTNNLTITCPSIAIANEQTEVNAGYRSLPALTALSVPHLNAMYVDKTDWTIKVGVGYGGARIRWEQDHTKIFLALNMYGYLSSPYPLFQELFNGRIRGTTGLKVVSGSEIDTGLKAGKLFSNFHKISKDYSFETANPWTAGTGATMTWNANASEFETGLNYVQIIQTGYAQTIKIPIPDSWRKVGAKIRLVASYKSDKAVSLKAYFRNTADSDWVNNAGATNGSFFASSAEKTLVIDRKYESGVGYFVLYTSANVEATIKIGSVQLFAESGLVYEQDSSYVTIQKTVADTGGDYTAIRAAIKACTGAGEANRYKITVKKGNYNEIDVTSSPDYHGTNNSVFVVEGEDKKETILHTDGASTELAPVDYSVNAATYGGVAINTIPQAYKHAIWINSSITFRNMTIDARVVKYATHADATGNYDVLFDNCRIVHFETNNDGYHVVGIGLRYGQYLRFHNCTFVLDLNHSGAPTTAAALFAHNWNNQAGPTGLEIINCDVENGHILYATDLGSGHDDHFIVENCRTNDPRKGIIYGLTTGYYTPTPATEADYPYCLSIDVRGGDIGYYKLNDNRSAAGLKALALNDYHVSVRNNSASTIAQGTAVKKDWANLTTTKQIVIPATDNNFDFVVWRDIAATSEGYATPKNKTVQVLAVAANYAKGDMLKINASGQFEKTVTVSECVAVTVEALNLASAGLIWAYLKR
jgi:hypothetical protein